jgi:shikimate kinase
MAGHLILIGFMGAGKTSVGEALALRLGLRFLDTDMKAEERAGMRITEIFKIRGEEHFRELESSVISELAGEEASVVSCGGGAVLEPGNRRALRNSGGIFYLRVSAEEISRRLADDEERPLLAGEAGRRKRVEIMLAEREPVYREMADYVIEAGGREAGEVAEEIERIWRGSR